MRPLSRRRFLTIAASAAAVPAWAGTPSTRWRGMALGAGASMRLEGLTPDQAAPIFAAVEAELSRLEDIFSLHRPDSTLSRLNRDGVLPHPPAELLQVLSLSGRLHAATAGAFDPTVQPLWALQADHAARGETPSADALSETRTRTGWPAVRFDTGQVRLARKGMALTLNGVAQGFVTDAIRALLLRNGLRDILIDIGEIAANGQRGDGAAWTAGVAAPDGTVLHRVRLTDRALATSAPRGTLLDPLGKIGHILDPETGRPGAALELISISAASAAVADGLSTACCLLPRDAVTTAIAGFPDAKLEFAS